MTQEDLGEANQFLTILGTDKVTYRTSNNCIENKNDGLSVTFQGYGTITITFSSTGGSTVSRLGLQNANGEYLVADVNGTTAQLSDSSLNGEAVDPSELGTYEVKGTGSGATVTFTISAPGTYTINCPSITLGRGARILNVSMTDIF